jgi:acyl-CoA thioesterase
MALIAPKMTAPHPFDEAIALTCQEDGQFIGHTSAPYGNFVGPFGGISAAQMLNAVLLHPQRLGDPVSLTINFCAAVADGAFSIQARPARTNRSTQHWVIEMFQAGETVLTATAVTAVRRTTHSLGEATMPVVPSPEDTASPPRFAPMQWLKRYDIRFIQGGFPEALDDTDAGHSLTQVWLRDALGRAMDFASLAAISDAFFPRLFLRRARFVPVGTVSMTIYFHAQAEQLTQVGGGFILGQAQGQHFQNGFFDQTAQLWSQSGEMLVTTHQTVYYKE